MTAGEGTDQDRVLALYDASVRDVYRYVHRLCLDHSIAEDVTQDVFVAALSNPPADISIGWLMRAARNRMIDIVRREATYREKVRFMRRGLDSESDEMDAVVEHLRMHEAMGRLQTGHRIVLMLHYGDDQSVADLADALGRSYKGAEALLARARAALRVELENDR